MTTALTVKDTMTSLEIAEVTGKSHQHVMRDIRSLLEQGVDASNFGLTYYVDKANRQQPCYNLTKKGCLLLASGYDALLREKIINRWEELELANKRQMPAVPQTFAQALRLAAEQAELIEAQQAELTVARPKADYFDGLVERNLLTNFRDTAKQIGLGQKEFVEKLLCGHFVYRDKKNKLKPYMEHVPKLFKINDWQKDDKAGLQTLITPEGKETFRLLFGKESEA